MTDAEQGVLDRFLDAYNRGDWDGLDELVTPEYVHRNGAVELALDQFKQGAA
jgi:hypothetical protein